MHLIAKQEIGEALKGKVFKTDYDRQEAESNVNTIIDKVWCDSNMGIENGWISDLRNKDISAFGTAKFPGSREYWISTMKRYNIHLITDIDLRKEQENFSYRVIDGITVSETIKKFDDILSSAGYATVGDFRIEE
jgi:hypothetical protein